MSTVVLPDGTVIDLLPMAPEEAERLVRFHHRLSAETTRRRFFSVHPELSPAELERFTHVDHLDREAFIAVGDGEIVGVGRFDRIGDRDTAEVAFVVVDSWQGRGVGTALFAHLVDRARELGIYRFIAQTLPENGPMLAVFRHAGLTITERLAGGVVDVSIELRGPTQLA
jgi:RimJ/RimL family protein N-acetyltransferase